MKYFNEIFLRGWLLGVSVLLLMDMLILWLGDTPWWFYIAFAILAAKPAMVTAAHFDCIRMWNEANPAPPPTSPAQEYPLLVKRG